MDDAYQRQLGHGGSANSLKYFKELPRRVRELVEEAGFGPFIQLLTAVMVDHAVMTALAERWWDTTNTFHFRFGEMTVTPLDFAAITGLRVGGEPIPFDPSIDLDDAALEWFLGRVLRHSGGVARSRVHLAYLAPGGSEAASDSAQAVFALCTLYCFLGAASRGVGDTIGGYWRVIELWAYEVLGMFPPENTCTNPHLLPRALAWGKEYRKAKERRGQSLGSPEFIVPGPLPPRVQRTETYTQAELEQFTVPDTDLERYLRRTLDYETYRDRYLATSLGVERELERRVAKAEARRARGEAGGEVGDETGGRGRGSRSSRGRGEAPSLLLVDEVPREWAEQAIMLMVGMRQLLKDCAKGRSLQTRPVPAPVLLVAPRVQPRRSTRTQPQDTTSLPASTSAGGRGTQRAGVGQFEVVPRGASRRRPAPEESEEDTEESLESRALGSTDSSTASGLSGDDDDRDDVESSESEGR
ncbi:hypothetical protein RHMOL_Rhmol01G0180900 [Rhododendron molle]|uniref:Uncharacterized protein n=1 Tax=Rhododendron molle TaxID=49168 RepID=A0ACC0Q311_RHOML|nr:hypothetical protein RHMOL_Rhmol01G0180900 [Rhododendron molle]